MSKNFYLSIFFILFFNVISAQNPIEWITNSEKINDSTYNLITNAKIENKFFILIGLFAILTSFKYNANIKLSFALIINWVLIVLIIINEKIELFYFPEILILVPSATIILLHLYIKNNFCQCKNQIKNS